jgi:hypothetical protein
LGCCWQELSLYQLFLPLPCYVNPPSVRLRTSAASWPVVVVAGEVAVAGEIVAAVATVAAVAPAPASVRPAVAVG